MKFLGKWKNQKKIIMKEVRPRKVNMVYNYIYLDIDH